MKRLIYTLILVVAVGFIGYQIFPATESGNDKFESFEMEHEEEGGLSKETRIREALEFDFEITKDPALGYPPTERLFDAYEVIKRKEVELAQRKSANGNIRWRERGPYAVGGRTRTILIDANDPTGETVWTAGVAGGLWKTTSVSANPPNWQITNDFFENMAICAIAQDPNNPEIMYFGTGEGFPNIDAVRGGGIWKSEDAGETWNRLTSTSGSTFWFIQRILVHPNGAVFALTRSGGLMRSGNGGGNWQAVLTEGNGGSNSFNDIELAPDGTIYVAGEYRSNGGASVWKSPNGNPGTFTEITSSMSNANRSRIELTLAPTTPHTLYAVAAIGGVASEFYVSGDGGASWQQRGLPNIDPGGQAWYDLLIECSPHNPEKVLVGAVRMSMTDNGGQNWVDVTRLHVDQHYALWSDDPNVCYIGNDGGIYRTTNAAGPASALQYDNLNQRYNVTQFYAADLSPELYSNDFIAGSQDNNTIRFFEPGISNTFSVIGGDGMFCHIDQDEPNIWIGSSQFANYQVSTDGGLNFSSPPGFPGGNGGFVNRSDYDWEANVLYFEDGPGGLARWDIDNNNGGRVNFTNGNFTPTAITASPNVENRVYVAGGGRVYYIDNANTAGSYDLVRISPPDNAPLGGVINCIVIEKGNEDHVMITTSNYGGSGIRETRDGGESWDFTRGDLPDQPVRWGLFHPLDPTKAFIATETGVWSTELLDGPNTVWDPHVEFPNVRTDMLQYRESDNLIIAASHARGLWSTDALSPPKAFFEFPKAGYTDVDILFLDNSVNSSSREWDFGDGQSSGQLEAFNAYENIGVYNVTMSINDGLEVLSDQIKIVPDRTTPYIDGVDNYGGDFEGELQEFAAYHVSGTPLERGSSNIPGKSGTNSGSNAWVLGINEGQYANNTETMLYTPNYDLSEDGIYEFRFSGKWAIQQGFDGLRVEYSLDRGQSWTQLGVRGDDWYNFSNSSTGTATAFPLGSDYFTGQTTGGWKEYKYLLNDLVGNPDVAFRFVFKSDGANTSTGFAIDDVKVIAFTGELATNVIEFKGEFLSFEDIQLDWVTEPEYQNARFELEVSNNGRDFDFVESIPGAGIALDPQSYTIELGNQKRQIYFFRLKVVSFDESFFYTETIVLKREETALGVQFIYPNPVVDVLGIAFNGFVTEPTQIEIFDAVGRLMYQEDRTVQNVFTELNISGLAPGTYILRITIGEEEFTEKISKN
ncbi:MAG: T9SS type A sorting domain-containing protein [Bacteroidota bacterium]